jgi:hypothetical protein
LIVLRPKFLFHLRIVGIKTLVHLRIVGIFGTYSPAHYRKNLILPLSAKEWCHVHRKQNGSLVRFQILCVNQITPFDNMRVFLAKHIERLMGVVTGRLHFYRLEFGPV